MGVADGSIMPNIMTAHIAHRSARCGTSQTAVIIHALAPVMGPYMSRAITEIQIQETSGNTISNTTAGVRLYRNADSITVGGGAFWPIVSTIDGSRGRVGGGAKSETRNCLALIRRSS